jgi:glutathione S-transferase
MLSLSKHEVVHDGIQRGRTMKLCYSVTSPYVRKVVAAGIELGLDGKIERQPTSAWDPASKLGQINPLGKVPALVTDKGEALYDSPVICEYLDSLAGGGKLFPAIGEARWTALRQQALADGIMDAGVSARLESTRPAGTKSDDWIARQRAAISRALDALEAEAASLGGGVTIGHVAIGCALGYLDFRFAADDWRKGRPKLAAWFEGFSKRPSIATTVPKDPA